MGGSGGEFGSGRLVTAYDLGDEYRGAVLFSAESPSRTIRVKGEHNGR